jgi:hypothetical protein
MCKKFGSGPCGHIFQQWLDCTDRNPGKDAEGHSLHLTNCIELAEQLSKCLDDHSEHYTKYDQDNTDLEIENENELKNAWIEFVTETEDNIRSRVYQLQDFPTKIAPTMQVRLETKTGAAYFRPEMDGSSIVVAYLLDERGNVLAAASKDDMDMGSQFGCVLTFDVLRGMKSATCRAIYDKDGDSVTVFSKTMLVPLADK